MEKRFWRYIEYKRFLSFFFFFAAGERVHNLAASAVFFFVVHGICKNQGPGPPHLPSFRPPLIPMSSHEMIILDSIPEPKLGDFSSDYLSCNGLSKSLFGRRPFTF